MTVHFRDSASGKPWHRVEAGSGQALVDALTTFSAQCKMPDLDKRPIAFVGLSTGGQFAYHWACWKPAQTLCFITLKGGYHNESFQPQVLGIPALWVTADQDLAFRQKNIRTVFEKHRAEGAPWTLAVEPQAGHECENASRLIAPYLLMIKRHIEKQNKETFRQDAERGGRDARAPSKKDFEKLLRDFEEGKSLEDWAQLSLNSKALPNYAMASPSTLDVGPTDSGHPSAILEIELTANKESPSWDRVALVDPESLWDLLDAPSPDHPGRFRLRLKPRADLPLGLFKTSARFRFYQGKEQLLGGLNLPASTRITGDVEISPGSLYLGVLDPNTSVNKTLTVKSTNPKRLQWLPAKSSIPSYAKIETLDPKNGSLQLRCTVGPVSPAQLEESGQHMKLCFQTDRDWVVQVPVILSMKP